MFKKLNPFYYIENLSQQIREIRDVKKILNSNSKFLDINLLKSNLSNYSNETLALASKELEILYSIINIKNYSNFIMIGCGATAETLINFSLNNPHIECIGLDRNKKVLKNPKLIKNKFNLNKINYFLSDGTDFNFSNYSQKSIILIAELVKPKFDILYKIVNSVNMGNIIIVRDPLGFEKLFFESSNYKFLPNLNLLKEESFLESNGKISFLSVN